jgi:molybdopterin molybdotransferase
MQGYPQLFRPVIEAVLMERITKRPGKTHFVRAVVKKTGERHEVWTTGNQSSGVLTSMVKADGLLIFPSDSSEIEKGQVVKVQLLDKSFRGQTVPGY